VVCWLLFVAFEKFSGSGKVLGTQGAVRCQPTAIDLAIGICLQRECSRARVLAE